MYAWIDGEVAQWDVYTQTLYPIPYSGTIYPIPYSGTICIWYMHVDQTERCMTETPFKIKTAMIDCNQTIPIRKRNEKTNSIPDIDTFVEDIDR